MLFWREVDISFPNLSWDVCVLKASLHFFWTFGILDISETKLSCNDFDLRFWKLTFSPSIRKLKSVWIRLCIIFCAILLEKYWGDWKVRNVQLVRELNTMVFCWTWTLPVCRRGLLFYHTKIYQPTVINWLRFNANVWLFHLTWFAISEDEEGL